MRNITLMAVLGMLMAMTVNGQLNLEKVVDYSLTSTKINQTEYKFYLMDVVAGQCRIYNTDHSLWKTIPISLPSGYYLYDVKFVSQNLFNTDGLIEFWYSAYEWVSTGTSSGYYRYISKVINENGSVLATITGGAYAYVIQTGTDQFKLVVYAYDNSVTPYTVKTYLYGLPNPSTALNFLSFLPEDPYPNPADGFINLPLDGAKAGALLQVFSTSGQFMAEYKTNGEPYYRLNTGSWAPGIYAYRLVTNGRQTQAKQFVIQ
ncbi:MAG TPA: T9SS type A sorting domain-containing protein [Prolixibacteraceae bacterium]|nr:T9SS type A sorting domain-containing protein [Prolixibacteraceae bacterium]